MREFVKKKEENWVTFRHSRQKKKFEYIYDGVSASSGLWKKDYKLIKDERKDRWEGGGVVVFHFCYAINDFDFKSCMCHRGNYSCSSWLHILVSPMMQIVFIILNLCCSWSMIILSMTSIIWLDQYICNGMSVGGAI